MISANDFRKGLFFEMDGITYEIIDFQHVKPGKGAAFVRSKIKNLETSTITDHTFNPNDRFQRVMVETKDMQYLYNDGQFYYFMDPESFEQIPFSKEAVEEAIKWIKENDNAQVRFVQGQAHDVEAPFFVELEVTHTEPAVKGDTSSGATKPATVETGYTLNVPLFVNTGDILKIDTRTGEYVSRV